MQPTHPVHRASPLAAGIVTVLATVLVALGAAPAAAHPLGNFTVNVYAGLRVTPSEVAVDYVVDLAEVAGLQARPFIDRDGDGDASDRELASYAEAGCAKWAEGLAIEEGGRGLRLRTAQTNAAMTPGEGGLPTLRIECRQVAERPGGAGERRIAVTDRNFAQRAGWREVTATADGVTLVSSDVPASSLSDRLAAYPEDRLSSPPDRRSALLIASADGSATAGAAAPAAAVLDPGAAGWAAGWTGGVIEALSGVVTRRMLEPGLAAAAVIAALALGALHALAPGHGKSVIAAYLVGQRGTVRQAAALALSVTLTHTAGVLVLGGLLWTAAVTAPERVYPLLGVASGALIAVLGAGMLVRVRRARAGSPAGEHHRHPAPHPVGVAAGGPTTGVSTSGAATTGAATTGTATTHPRPLAPSESEPALRARTVVTLGFAGGLVPTPSALLVLLGSLAIGRVWLGVLLVAVYGLGMAISLVGIGLALVHTRTRLERRLDRLASPRLHSLTHALPTVTAAFVLLAGVGLMARSVLAG
jgi:ABC-type nickel/cobalt efflux system permease component RcnA